MRVIADLQLHSKYSRAVSPKMVLAEIARWAMIKKINLMATGDWTHPLWFREITTNLEEKSEGLFSLKEKIEPGDGVSENVRQPLFLLSGEVSSIYTQGGKARRIHNLIFAPSFATVDKINKELTRRGSNLMSDGRPIIGLTSIEIAEVVFSIDENCLLIPAHCLLPNSLIHTNPSVKAINTVKIGDKVYTHQGRYQKVKQVHQRLYKGSVYTIKPWYFSLGLTTTSEHPYLGIRTVKKCKSTGDVCRPFGKHKDYCIAKHYDKYQPAWIPASLLETGDILIFPRGLIGQQEAVNYIKMSDYIKEFKVKNGTISPKGTRKKILKDTISINSYFCRLAGYYLAEGSTDNRDSISFCFHCEETMYIEDVKKLMKEVFGIDNYRVYRRKNHNSLEITFCSKVLSKFFAALFYSNPDMRNATTKYLPIFFLKLPTKFQSEIIKGWWRGDKGYTSSRLLMNQIKQIFLRLGIIPSISVDSLQAHLTRGNHNLGNRIVKATTDSFFFSNLAFFENADNLLNEVEFQQFKTRLSRRHGYLDKHYVYLPIRKIEKDYYEGEVFNIDVEEDNSYVSEFATVHNCWTPWFSLYGSKSGFDSIEECFGKYANRIYAVETGLSSNPSMNWRIADLDSRTIISCSDAHSGPKLGREATVFEIKDQTKAAEIKYQDIADAIRQNPKGKCKIVYTIEFYPEEGKYHYSGHRVCLIRQKPEETKQMGTICPVCSKPLTVGVMHRVEELAARSEAELELYQSGMYHYSKKYPKRPPFIQTVPLLEIISQSIGSPLGSEKVMEIYLNLCQRLDGEFSVLLKSELADIAKVAGDRIAQAVFKVRQGDIYIDPGYDGVFGVVKIWEKKNPSKSEEKKQLALFNN